MRLRSAVPALLLALAISHPAGAVAPEKDARPQVEAGSGAKVTAPLREVVAVTSYVPPVRQRAWDAFVATAGARWTATWDVATGVPSRAYGGSIEVPGSSASPAIALAAARAFLANHLDLFAPGVTVDDLELVSNHDDGRIRSVGFVQRHDGLRVVGGQISVRFMNDRIYVVSSQILPDVDVGAIAAGPALPSSQLRDRARTATVRDLGLANAVVNGAGDAVIVPLVGDDAVLGYRIGVPVEVDGDTEGAWLVYADPTTGDTLMRQSTRAFATGTLVYDVPVRWPGGERGDYPAARAYVRVNGTDVTTGEDGTLTWTPDQSATLVTSVVGDLVTVRNTTNDGELEATSTLAIAPSGTARWTQATDDLSDAQLTTFVHLQIAKDYARALVSDPAFRSWLDEQMGATVNRDDTCNAFYAGSKVTFFIANEQCENTGRLADVVYHEFGHGVHDHLVIEGVGRFPSEIQEGVADFYTGLITGDPAMGVGFFYSDEPLRHMDPILEEAVWPDDIGEVHTTGLIYGGAMWDLRTLAMRVLGDADGLALAERIFLATVRRATDTPSTLIEALAEDDDDGDLSNGTPHECIIREAFGYHGLRTTSIAVQAPDVVPGTEGETMADVQVTLGGLSAACLGDEVDHVTLIWGSRSDSNTPTPGSVDLAPQGADVYAGQMPLPEAGDVAEYWLEVVYTDQTVQSFPDNRGDPTYQLYRGELIDLYCYDFETDPFDASPPWTVEGHTQWNWGVPNGQGGDPAEAYSGQSVVGTILGGDGMYDANLDTRLVSPVFDVGNYSDVRLQYRRWLGVEDGFFDDAKIFANGEQLWQNWDGGGDLDLHTTDKEWVFRDLGLSTRIYDGTVQLEFRLESDGGLEMGGWTLDDLCIVADPNAICGDGTINGVEQCDEGGANADVADVCRTNCRVARCGDGIVDTLEECDDGNREDDATCSPICENPPRDGGCCSTGTDPAGALAPLALVVGGLLVGSRRRRRAAS